MEYILEVNFEIEVTLPFLVCGNFWKIWDSLELQNLQSNFHYFWPRVSEESKEN